MTKTPGRVTSLLREAAAGDSSAEQDLLHLVHAELKRIALRRPAVAAIVWLIATTAVWSHALTDAPLVAAQMLVILLILRRLGLLAAAIAISVHLMTLLVPLSVLPQAAMVVAIVAAMMAIPVTNRRVFLH